MAVHRGSSDALHLEVQAPSFRELFARSSQVEPKLKRALRKRIRDASKGIVSAVQAEARQQGEGVAQSAGWKLEGRRMRRSYGYAAGGGRSTGLRDDIAAGVSAQIMTGTTREGVRIVSRGRLAGAWESKRGWRHPVFGNRGAWIQQSGRPGYFFETVSAGVPAIQAAVESAMAEAVKSLEGS